ncbi:hypothetical protein B0O99DRAFT_692744 [Bisporella sp. PMI_857]|nr:hypothetical protein B0O99DRAFT_692744 [Bisporella sp. PMI_857]
MAKSSTQEDGLKFGEFSPADQRVLQIAADIIHVHVERLIALQTPEPLIPTSTGTALNVTTPTVGESSSQNKDSFTRNSYGASDLNTPHYSNFGLGSIAVQSYEELVQDPRSTSGAALQGPHINASEADGQLGPGCRYGYGDTLSVGLQISSFENRARDASKANSFDIVQSNSSDQSSSAVNITPQKSQSPQVDLPNEITTTSSYQPEEATVGELYEPNWIDLQDLAVDPRELSRQNYMPNNWPNSEQTPGQTVDNSHHHNIPQDQNLLESLSGHSADLH